MSRSMVERECHVFATLCDNLVKRDLVGATTIPGSDVSFSELRTALDSLFTEIRTRIGELHDRTAQHEAMLRSIGEGLYVVDKQYRILLMNPRAREVLGLEGTHIIGRPLGEVVRLEDEYGVAVAESERPISEALRARETIEYSTTDKLLFFVNRKTGIRFPVTVTVAPVISSGETVAAVSVFRDSSAELEVRRAKDEFISLASHQLRTPLSIISLNLEILDRYYAGSIPEEIEAHLKEIAHASRRMQRLVNSVLNASRIEMGSVEPTFSDVDIGVLVDTVITDNSRLLGEKSLTVVYRKPEAPLFARADPRLVEVVLDNLLSNAVKYSFSNTAVTVEVQELPSGHIISVSNHGRGIPAYQRQRIFSKLFRADNAEEAAEDGTGLGLYIARSLTEKMGGSIWFTSEHTDVTTFFVRLMRGGTNQ